MKPIHIIGHANCGKTTLIVDLIEEMVNRDIKVGSLKHSAHVHELDKPGKDSFQHRKAGAEPASMMTQSMAAIYLPASDRLTPEKLLEKYYSNVDIVLIEGWISGPYDKIEVWRNHVKSKPLFSSVDHVKAFVSDDDLDPESMAVVKEKQLNSFKRCDCSLLTDFILDLA
ncbi:MAG: molybdopterin-guanine dinucleotide biosynthesis protein B [Desulfobacula sp.]|nr:molybdopterin-guanine dinucleotide biosynthesis protein B [Desulfobacula sp.]